MPGLTTGREIGLVAVLLTAMLVAGLAAPVTVAEARRIARIGLPGLYESECGYRVRAAGDADRILNGARPADPPIGPPSIPVRADKVIE